MFRPRDSNYRAWCWQSQMWFTMVGNRGWGFSTMWLHKWKTITVKKCKNVASYDNHNLSIAPDCGNEGNSTWKSYYFLVFSKQLFCFCTSFYSYMWIHMYLEISVSTYTHGYKVANLRLFFVFHFTEHSFFFIA